MILGLFHAVYGVSLSSYQEETEEIGKEDQLEDKTN